MEKFFQTIWKRKWQSTEEGINQNVGQKKKQEYKRGVQFGRLFYPIDNYFCGFIYHLKKPGISKIS